MSKLKLEHLAPYLPYGLDMIINTPFGSENRKLELDCGHDFGLHLMQCNVKPILRHVRDLDCLIENEFKKYGRGEKHDYKIIELFSEENGVDEILENTQLNTLRYDCVEYLFKNHYDFFGLIDKGLAININTLDNE